MTAVGVFGMKRVGSGATLDHKLPEAMSRSIALSAGLHLLLIAIMIVGLPSLFRKPPPLETPIAVQLVNIAPETKATQPNPFRPKAEAKPEPAPAPPAPKPEPKPEPPQAVAAPPPASANAPPPPVPEPKPEIKTPATPPPPPPPPKPVEAKAPPMPPEAKPKPEPRPLLRREAKADPAAFQKLIKSLEQKHEEKRDDKKAEPAAFDALLKNLTRDQTADADEAPRAPHRMASLAPPSSQPKAPLASQMTASQIDLIREQLRPCFNPPFGAKEKPDLVADIRVVMNPDGTVQQARVVDQGQYNSDPIYRAIADAGVRALKNPQCSPLRFPPEQFAAWQTFIFGFSTRDMQ